MTFSCVSYCHSGVATVKGAVVIDQIQDSELSCVLYNFYFVMLYREHKAINERPQQICC